MRVKQILDGKGREIISIAVSASICSAMEMMLDRNVAALLVMNGEELQGIISQKDMLKTCRLSENGPKGLTVKDLMTPAEKLITCTPDDPIEVLMTKMTEKRIRHLPVLHEKKVVGIISVGDVIKTLLDASREDNKLLNDYISGKYPS